MVEIGNYDGFYGEGRVFSAEEVLRLTRETRALLGDRIPLSVTVPHTLALDQQVQSILHIPCGNSISHSMRRNRSQSCSSTAFIEGNSAS